MKVPISWLKEYVAFDAAPDEVARWLTFSGIEVEGLQTVGPDLAGVVVGEVTGIEPHPAADRLLVCRVFDGRQSLRVVCGARNFSVGDKAAFAGVGIALPTGRRIERATIRGEASEGMLCAEDELGISDDHTGVLVVPREVRAGTPLAEVVGPPEVVLQLEVTWNRPDCLSVIGIAREVAALCGSRLRLPAVDFPEAGDDVAQLAGVRIEDPRGCPRYTARVLSQMTPGPSPRWMQKRLALCGVRPISNVVDITNYVMLECGQPLHAFDYNLIEGRRIEVRRVRPGERLATLDGVERPVTPDMLVIADAQRPVALAGIMGGAGSEIGAATRTVLLESACFDPALLHRTATRLGLATESSHRFERGVDVGAVDWCSRRAARLMVEHAGAVAARGVVDVFPNPPAERRVACRFRKAAGLLGVAIEPERIVSILNSLELAVVGRDADGCTVRVPTFRPDIEIEADLIEEVARIHGLDKVPAAMPLARVNPDVDDDEPRRRSRCRRDLAGLGLMEIVNYSFVSEAILNQFPADASRRVALPNPVSAEYAVMRDSLLPQMAAALGRNYFQQTDTAAFFEMGQVFGRGDAGEIREEERLAIGLMGKAGRGGLDLRRPVEREEMFFWVKGIVECLLAAQRAPSPVFAPADDPRLEPGWGLAVAIEGRGVGVVGLLREGVRKEWRIPEPVGVAELAVRPVVERVGRVPRPDAPAAYPGVTRDVALVVDESVRHDDVVRAIRKHAPVELTSVRLFDIFRGEGIGAGKKSLAYSLIYRSQERTLTDEDANRYHEAIKDALRRETGAEIRES